MDMMSYVVLIYFYFFCVSLLSTYGLPFISKCVYVVVV